MLEYFTDAIAVYKIGSSSLPFITNPGDIDYLIIYKTAEKLNAHLEELLTYKREGPIKEFFCISLDTLKSGKWKTLHFIDNVVDGPAGFGYTFFQTYLAPLNSIFLHFAELLEGQDLNLQQYVQLTPEYWQILCEGCYVVREKFLYFNVDRDDYDAKCWYYLLLAMFICLNNSYILTDAQIKIIQNAHDKKYSLKECCQLTKELEMS